MTLEIGPQDRAIAPAGYQMLLFNFNISGAINRAIQEHVLIDQIP